MIKKLRYWLEAKIVWLGLGLFKIIGIKKSSNLGSFLARVIGKLIPVNKLARDNLNQAFPDFDKEKIDQILDEMWDNLGRVSAEFVHVCSLDKKGLMQYIECDDETLKNLELIKKNHHGGIIFSGHIGNWEIGPKFFLNHNLNVKTVYRPLNNSVVDDMTASIRGTELISKSAKGNKQIIKEIKDGNYVIILIDQRASDGELITFFGENALTSVAIARLALKYNIPLIPARSIRINKEFKFKVEIAKPIEFNKTDSITNEDVISLMTKVNKKLEEWISEYPAQWFWVHNRWKK